MPGFDQRAAVSWSAIVALTLRVVPSAVSLLDIREAIVYRVFAAIARAPCCALGPVLVTFTVVLEAARFLAVTAASGR